MRRFLLSAPLLAVAACTPGTAERVSVGEFDSVDNQSGAKIAVIGAEKDDVPDDFPNGVPHDDAPLFQGEVAIDCDKEDVNAYVDHGTLVIDAEADSDCEVQLVGDGLRSITVRGDGDVVAFGTLTGLHSIDVRGHGGVVLESVEIARGIDMFGRGSGEIIVGHLVADALHVGLSGNGDVTLRGAVDFASLDLSGHGSFDGSDLVIGDLDADISGSGDAIVYVTGKVTGKVTGQGELIQLAWPHGMKPL